MSQQTDSGASASGVRKDDTPDPGVPIDEGAKRKRVTMDPCADGAVDLPMPATEAEVVGISPGFDRNHHSL